MLCIIGILFGYTIRLYLAHINVILWSLLRLSKIFHSIQIFLRIFAAETAQYDTMALLKFRFAPPKKRSVESRQKSKELGITGEQMAARYLEDQGYVILDRNYRKGHKEVDIIALDHGTLVVIEVKTRSNEIFLPAEHAVNHQKRLNIIRVTNNYVRRYHRTEPIRFDIIAIVGNGVDAEIRHSKNAFHVMCF